MNDLNDALANDDKEAILNALMNPALKLRGFEEKNFTHYLTLMQEKKQKKSKVDFCREYPSSSTDFILRKKSFCPSSVYCTLLSL